MDKNVSFALAENFMKELANLSTQTLNVRDIPMDFKKTCGFTKAIANYITDLNFNLHLCGHYVKTVRQILDVIKVDKPNAETFLCHILKEIGDSQLKTKYDFLTFCSFLFELIFALDMNWQPTLVRVLVKKSSLVLADKFCWKSTDDFKIYDAYAKMILNTFMYGFSDVSLSTVRSQYRHNYIETERPLN